MATENQDRPRERVTITDVAAALGVAVSTVSNAYNRPDQLSAQLRERILATATELGYPGPDPVARGLRRQRAGAIGVLFPERLSFAFSDQATVQLLDGIACALEPSNLGLLLVPGRDDEPTTMQNAIVDGFIVYSMVEDNPLLAAVLRRRLPTVLLDQPPCPGVPVITVDDVGGARQAATHLLDFGHRRFAIITDRLSKGARRRTQPGLGHSMTRMRILSFLHVCAFKATVKRSSQRGLYGNRYRLSSAQRTLRLMVPRRCIRCWRSLNLLLLCSASAIDWHWVHSLLRSKLAMRYRAISRSLALTISLQRRM